MCPQQLHHLPENTQGNELDLSRAPHLVVARLPGDDPGRANAPGHDGDRVPEVDTSLVPVGGAVAAMCVVAMMLATATTHVGHKMCH
mmetsp:Transcript_51970/g.121699  ORF Transcript_51970/g.121699 Transcript_51970/m.121699 type:complete len:87 (-) Transcript_51970:303-563(-)